MVAILPTQCWVFLPIWYGAHQLILVLRVSHRYRDREDPGLVHVYILHTQDYHVTIERFFLAMRCVPCRQS